MLLIQWLLVATGLLSLLPGDNSLPNTSTPKVIITTSTEFSLGNYVSAPQNGSIRILDQCPGITGHVVNIVLALSAAKGMSLRDYQKAATDSAFYQALSDQLNHCGKGKKFNESEVYYHAALAIWPWNALAVKNMGFHMELNHRAVEAASLYNQVRDFL